MSIPEIVLCPDGHFRFIIWGLGPYIADYPEQVLITCIVQGWCPRYVPIISDSDLYVIDVFVYNRCRAPSGRLDNEEDTYERRSREHTDFLCTKCELGVLYDNYGIIGDIIVCRFSHPLILFSL